MMDILSYRILSYRTLFQVINEYEASPSRWPVRW